MNCPLCIFVQLGILCNYFRRRDPVCQKVHNHMYSIINGKFSSYFIYTAFIGRMNINHVPEIITFIHVYLELAHFCLFCLSQAVCWFGQSKDRTE